MVMLLAIISALFSSINAFDIKEVWYNRRETVMKRTGYERKGLREMESEVWTVSNV